MVIIDVLLNFKMDGAEKKYITSSSKNDFKSWKPSKNSMVFLFEATIKKHKFAKWKLQICVCIIKI